MKRKILIIIALALSVVALTVLLSGCAGGGDDLEGKNIVTFEVNGGILNYGTSSTDSKVNYAYYPGTYIKDPTTFPNYSISRSGYNFTGWYTGKDCKPNEKWDFSQPFNTESLTLYAGWEIAIKYTYSVNYMDGNEKVTLGTYKVSSGDKFEDWRKYAAERDDHTATGYYSDPECTVPWDFTAAHPGGAADLDIPVYVSYIVGNWNLVDTYDKLRSAVKSGNVYLTADIDCGGDEFCVSGTFNNIFEGNGFKITNFTVNKTGTTFNPSCAIFQTLGEKADIRNVSFENVTYNFFDIANAAGVKANVAALAVGMNAGAKVTDVSVSGTLETNYDDTYPCISEVFYYTDAEQSAPLSGVTNFTANITVNKQS